MNSYILLEIGNSKFVIAYDDLAWSVEEIEELFKDVDCLEDVYDKISDSPSIEIKEIDYTIIW